MIRAESHAALPAWKERFRGLAQEIDALERCVDRRNACTSRYRLAWAHFLLGLAGMTAEERLEAVNRFGNDRKTRPFAGATPDPAAVPAPAAEIRAALYKYASLRVLGLAADRLQIVEARDLLAERATVLLLVRTDAAAWLLRPDTPALVEAGRLSQLLPLLSVNEHARWVHLPPAREPRPARLAPLPPERR